MKINFGIFSKISAVALVLMIFVRVFIHSNEMFIVISVLIGVGIASTYYSLCDSKGQFRKEIK